MRLFHADELAAEVARRHLGPTFTAPLSGYLVLNDANDICGVVIVNNCTATNADITAAGRHCWTPSVVRQLARYLFGQLGVRRVTAHTAVGNVRAIRALERMGFKRECVCPHWFESGAAAQYRLLREECRMVKL